jgi:hypothetical protein
MPAVSAGVDGGNPPVLAAMTHRNGAGGRIASRAGFTSRETTSWTASAAWLGRGSLTGSAQAREDRLRAAANPARVKTLEATVLPR